MAHVRADHARAGPRGEAWDVPPTHVAFAYAFAHPNLASVLFGASSPEQLRENAAAWSTFQQLDASQRDAVVRLT